MAAVPGLCDLDLKRMEREVARELEQFTGLLRGDIPRARQALKRLLSDRVEFRPAVPTRTTSAGPLRPLNLWQN
jgi:hypothetical protein